MRITKMYEAIIKACRIISVFILFAIIANLLSGCESRTEEHNNLYGAWRLSHKQVNGAEVGNDCEKNTTMYINNVPTEEQWYYHYESDTCKSFPNRQIELDYNERYVWIDGWKYEYKILNGHTLVMWYTTYNPDGSPLKVVETWKRQ